MTYDPWQYDELRNYKLEDKILKRKTLAEKGFFYNDTYKKWFITDFKIGDALERVTQASTVNSAVQKGQVVMMDSFYDIVSAAKYEYDENNNYVEIYQQKIKVVGSRMTYLGSNFKKVEKTVMLGIETNRPTFVREFVETDGKRSYVGDFLPFDSASAARVWCSDAITDAIRNTNTYRRFAIFTENSIAQAKKPEIEFA